MHSCGPEGEPDLEKMGQRVQNFLNSKISCLDGFQPEQRLAIIKAIIEFTCPSESSGLIENRPRRTNRFEDDVVVFYENDWSDIASHHNRLTAKVRDVELKRAMPDHGLSLNLIFLSILDSNGCPTREYY